MTTAVATVSVMGQSTNGATIMAQPKELNFNEIETEQLIDLFENDDDETSEETSITKFCIDLDNNEVIDDEQFDYMEI